VRAVSGSLLEQIQIVQGARVSSLLHVGRVAHTI
jgi:hypothetical protein